MTDQLSLGLLPAGDAPAAVRPIHYLGSKVRLLAEIEALCDELDPERGAALDLFSGTGVVAARLARARDVTAVDIQEYARVLASALLTGEGLDEREVADLVAEAGAIHRALADGPLAALLAHESRAVEEARRGRPDALCDLTEHGILAHEVGEEAPSSVLCECLLSASALAETGTGVAGRMVLTRFYGGIYFSFEQALKLDALYAAASGIVGAPRVTALAALMSATSDTVISVGNQFAQPVRARARDGAPKPASVSALVRGRARDPFRSFADWCRTYADVARRRRSSGTEAVALRSDYRAHLAARSDRVGVVYADPPYTRDHYSRFYHVLETIAMGDEPVVSTVQAGGRRRLSRGLYRSERHQSPFSIKSQAPGAFTALFEGVARLGAPLILSYSPFAEGHRPRLMRIEDLAGLAGEYFADVEIRSATDVAHSKLNAAHLNAPKPEEAEVFVLCRP